MQCKYEKWVLATYGIFSLHGSYAPSHAAPIPPPGKREASCTIESLILYWSRSRLSAKLHLQLIIIFGNLLSYSVGGGLLEGLFAWCFDVVVVSIAVTCVLATKQMWYDVAGDLGLSVKEQVLSKVFSNTFWAPFPIFTNAFCVYYDIMC